MRKRKILGSISRIREKAHSDAEKGLLSSKAEELSQHTYEIYHNDRRSTKVYPELTFVVITRTSRICDTLSLSK